ncbi:LUD domain-containing protein [Desulfosporosinus metallidurans]|uniref:Iron-sulfur cluster-binding protein n=1 Tax=Desulfosporosinus metallidurans TaxID=1888891 RepID=A0A1Q8QZZ4_9FIRM|nr:LUD domain-containing protein [Desulfosporosinus metallidurans]OLN32895.1 Iron-sulfur cluster-binding protein [Desulfosporosinus metallidurans]
MRNTKAKMILKTIESNRKKLLQEYPHLASQVNKIKTSVAMNLKEYVEKAITSLKSKGCHVIVAADGADARQQILKILSGKKQVAMSKNPVFTEIALREFLKANDVVVTNTDLGERLAGTAVDAHPWIATINTEISNKVTVSQVKDEIKQTVSTLEYGITGADAIVEQNGTIALLESEGNVRFTSNLPYNHIVVAGLDKIVHTLEDALTVCRTTSVYGMGKDMLSYISFLSGPSRTADIEFKMVQGMHGPKEVYVILLDNGRLAAAESQKLDLLKCLGCGGCLVACPGYLEEGLEKGYRYTGKRAKVLIGFLDGVKQVEDADCGDCSLCNELCPVGIQV